jgi:TIGR03009 family protein
MYNHTRKDGPVRGIVFVVLGVVAWAGAGISGALGQVAKDGRAPAREARGSQGPGTAPPKAAAPAPAQNPTDPTGAKMKQLLKYWEQKSADLKTLDVKILRMDASVAWGVEQFEGRAILQSPNRAWLDFEKLVVDQRTKKLKSRVHEDRIICTGSEVWHYKGATRQIFIYPLEKDQRQRALEEGPLPFLFNMKAAEAEQRYRMSLLREDNGSYIVHVIPLLEIDKESFHRAMLQLTQLQDNTGKEYLLPTRIVLYGPDGKSTKDYTLLRGDVKLNVAVNPKNFEGVPQQGWTVHRNPAGGLAPGAPGNDPAAAQPAPKGNRRLGQRR